MILVTGGTGLLGSHLLYSLSETNEKVKDTKRLHAGSQSASQLDAFNRIKEAAKIREQANSALYLPPSEYLQRKPSNEAVGNQGAPKVQKRVRIISAAQSGTPPHLRAL